MSRKSKIDIPEHRRYRLKRRNIFVPADPENPDAPIIPISQLEDETLKKYTDKMRLGAPGSENMLLELAYRKVEEQLMSQCTLSLTEKDLQSYELARRNVDWIKADKTTTKVCHMTTKHLRNAKQMLENKNRGAEYRPYRIVLRELQYRKFIEETKSATLDSLSLGAREEFD